jgi:hypothetical protein
MVSFPLGRIVATPSIIEMLSNTEILNMIRRHSIGDWGELSQKDKKANDEALLYGNRILSSYKTKTGKVWIITESDRSATTILFASE